MDFLPVLLILLWWGLIFPVKSAVKKRVGEEVYQEIFNEYKKMKRDRGFGSVAILISVLILLPAVFYFAIGLSSHVSFENIKSLINSSLIFMCAGIYCYILAFVKAMANILGSSK